MKRRIVVATLIGLSVCSMLFGCKKDEAKIASEESLETIDDVVEDKEEEDWDTVTPTDEDIEGKASIVDITYRDGNKPTLIFTVQKQDSVAVHIVDNAKPGDTIYSEGGVPYFVSKRVMSYGEECVCVKRVYPGGTYTVSSDSTFDYPYLKLNQEGDAYRIISENDMPEYMESSVYYGAEIREDAVAGIYTTTVDSYREESLLDVLSTYDFSEYGWGSVGSIELDEDGKIIRYEQWWIP